ncbi:MAG: hypothetical protein ACK5HA_20700 [Planctomycetaceae bacterium]|jgi:hypothetical protein
MFSKNTRCNIVIGLWVTAMVAIGALSAYNAAVFVNKWVGVVIVALIAFGSAPDFEMAIFAVILTVLACVVAPLADALLLLPGGLAGLMLIFRSDDLLEWLYPPIGRPPEDSQQHVAPERPGSVQ